MERIRIDDDWEFSYGEPSNIPLMPQKQVRAVSLPHDFMIEGAPKADSVNGPATGFFDGATATYTKKLEVPAEWEDDCVLLECDGAFNDVAVGLNGVRMGQHHYGYSPFAIDLTGRLAFGQSNRLAVTVSNDAEPNSRWYPGGGLYRHVWLRRAPKVHIARDGVFAHLDHLAGADAFVTVEVEVCNRTAEDVERWACVLFDGRALGSVKVHVPARSSAIARTQVRVDDARIWDVDDPQVYEVEAVLLGARPVAGECPTPADVLDREAVTFGIRMLTVDSKNGLLLNGRPLKLKGGCVHHDNGILGAAAFADAEERKVRLHKQNGFNALRFSHNPPSRDMLEACDRLGMLVIDEAFDTWNVPKRFHDFSERFAGEWRSELEATVRRDRNHPCVAFWSVGNELPEQGGLADGYRTSAELAAAVRGLDGTRPVMGSLCSFFNGLDDADTARYWKSFMDEAQSGGGLAAGGVANLDSAFGRGIWNDRTEAFCAPWDLVGYNYLDYHYDEAAELFPNRVICATESKPGVMLEYWRDVERLPNLIGDFEWTSFDYLGEAGIGNKLYADPADAANAARGLYYAGYPWRSAGTGEFDLCGFEKPQLAYKHIVWGSRETYIASRNPANTGKVEILGRYAWPEVAHSWTWPVEVGVPSQVDVYSAADEVELLVNGRSLGRKPAGDACRLTASFDVPYEPGELVAVSYVDGVEVSRDRVVTAGAPAKLLAVADLAAPHGAELPADGQALCFARVVVADAAGNPVPYAEVEVSASVEGVATLQALGTGRPATEESYTAGTVATYEGRALAVVRAGVEPGSALLRVSSPGLESAELKLSVVPAHG